ncbi:hydrolase [Streptomyces sp. CB09001]|uniref:HAD family hydrolase n=1 Tax=unclassified Streptomyces TaxID=2593676 RepID=UPI000E20D0BD|nr:HAD family phosphatase [Streptomyces sp. CB09001]AXL93650.1 hydrolase [Streptomyces sp. CB09001]
MTPLSRTLPNWSPEAIVFDCDGTLMDTERHWQDARTRTFRDFGLPTPPGFAERAKGVHYLDCGRLMAQETNKPDLASDLSTALLAHFMSLVAEDPLTMPGATEFVRLCWHRLPLAVASNCPMEVVDESLLRAGLRRYFRHVVVPTVQQDFDDSDAAPNDQAEQAVRPKPWPDVYSRASSLCGVAPRSALAIEDSLTGVESASRAGLRVLGVGPLPKEGSGQADAWAPGLDSEQILSWLRMRVPVRATDSDEPRKNRGPA